MSTSGQILQSVLNKDQNALKVEGNENINVNISSQRLKLPIAIYRTDNSFGHLAVEVGYSIKQMLVDCSD